MASRLSNALFVFCRLWTAFSYVATAALIKAISVAVSSTVLLACAIVAPF